MTKKILFLTGWLASFIGLHAQTNEQVFAYSKSGDIISLKKDNHTITFRDYKKEAGSRVRVIKNGEAVYRFTITRAADGKRIQEIRATDEKILARVEMSGLNVLLPDGTVLRWKKKDGKHWAYLKDKQEVIQGEYRKVNGKKQLVITENADPNNEIIQLICLERGTDIVIKKGRTLPIIIGFTLIAIIKSATTTTPAG